MAVSVAGETDTHRQGDVRVIGQFETPSARRPDENSPRLATFDYGRTTKDGLWTENQGPGPAYYMETKNESAG